jgi:penicillin-binding protein 2
MPSEIKKHPEVINKVAYILSTDPQKLLVKLKDAEMHPDLFSPIYVGATEKAGIRVAETRDDLPGIGVELRPMRYYPDSKSFTHLLGYVWTPTKQDIERIKAQNRKPADYVGRAGVERAYETNLMGEPGTEEREIDAKRRSVRSMGGNAATPGDQLILSIDSELQKYATAYFADPKRNYVGAVVALDPKTGEILCLVSSPTFDQNLFVGGISDHDYEMLTNPNAQHPMIDRAIASSYPPGSTFKIVTSIAAYEKGIFDPDKHYYCGGGVKLGSNWFGCLSYHGSIGYYDAMAKSCNSFFYQLGRDAGVDYLRKACEDVGLGQRQGLEIGDVKGTVPTEEFMAKRGPWRGGDTFNFAIGQGYMAATPLQLANLAALVANNGTNYKPHLVHKIVPADGKGDGTLVQPEVFKQFKATPEFWSCLRKALVGVMDHGTASASKIPGVVWAGKTGSAQHGKDKNAKANAVFMGYAPEEDPKIAICVMIEGVGHGGDFAAPPARDLVQHYLTEGKSKGLANVAASPSANAALPPSPTFR